MAIFTRRFSRINVLGVDCVILFAMCKYSFITYDNKNIMLDFPMMRIVKIVHPAEFAQQFIRWDSKKGIRSLEVIQEENFQAKYN